ncbi:hypothetical protein MPTK1_8g16610 [Marchantia polymorpha subsp. ruderalis]|uniref:Glycosyltransferase family 92 protein n=1 Tax=Marchantia polymorpha TaxID=3197 RepID=A0A2R6W4J8_MARPO|nr:hypothetical protein MARPO_0154s0003 [Marchantia polymorpha]PTQ28771.1 hypothetical protein MARPO_0154s0003 [Marchantia polymorpha]BBN20123.1 hypothetical protein Mp_8g16610 [Marchantia polymorpha subsp. ruderalis]BBN20124.1 hypothetical protein Mp_8g16610 [Marchantia polymorpha subsp. ruderalis]|eukprot:PTQ28770.1 hypothetical protein MARPO_0154s0003 [Marchantia polymorpha]
MKMPVYLLAALPLTLALIAFTLSKPWSVRQFVATQQPLLQPPPLPAPPDCPDSGREDIGFIPEYAGWRFERPLSQIAVATTTSVELHVLLLWIYYHRRLGVDTFYIFVEGELESPEKRSILRSIPGVKVNSRTMKLREKQLKSPIWKGNWLLDYQYKPCNYQKYVRQALNLEAATYVARRAGMKWILHLSVDELIHPGGETHDSLASTLQGFNESVDLVVFPHYESVVESDSVQDPFTDVTLFKRSPSHITKRDYRQVFDQVSHNNSLYFLSQADGRIAARLQPGLHPSGPNRWSNAFKALRDVAADEAVVLHYTYTKFSDLTAMRSLCDECQAVPKLARRCFLNEFDSAAFIAAKTLSDEGLFQWYKDHVVWQNKTLVHKLVQRSILVRNHIPQIIIQGLREVGFFQEMIEAGSQAFEDSQMIEKLELKEMVRLGQEAGKFKLEMASLRFSKRRQGKVVERQNRSDLEDQLDDQRQSGASTHHPARRQSSPGLQLNSTTVIPSSSEQRNLPFALVTSAHPVQNGRRRLLASIRPWFQSSFFHGCCTSFRSLEAKVQSSLGHFMTLFW